MADAMARFEHIIESSKAGIRKPDPRIYHLAAARFGYAPEAMLFIDDSADNVAGARACGWQVEEVAGVEDLAGAAVFLASDASRFVNGAVIYVDGGVTSTL